MKFLVGIITIGLGLAIPALAFTPVDEYQDMEAGNPGQILTIEPQSSSHGSGGTWSIVGNTMTIATNQVIPLAGAVSVDGTNYFDTNDARSWMTDDDTQQQYVLFQASTPHETGSVGLFLTVGINAYNPTNSDVPVLTNVNVGTGDIYDAVVIGYGPTTKITRFAVCQIYDAVGGPYLEIETYAGESTHHSSPIQIRASQAYWVTLKYDGAAGMASLAVFNPTNWTEIGSTTLAQQTNTFAWMAFGRQDHHYNGPNTHSYFDNILIDYTTAAFPLFPGIRLPVPLTIKDQRNGAVALNIPSRIGHNYVVETSTNLLDWSAVYSNQATAGVLAFTNANTGSPAGHFYRAFLK